MNKEKVMRALDGRTYDEDVIEKFDKNLEYFMSITKDLSRLVKTNGFYSERSLSQII